MKTGELRSPGQPRAAVPTETRRARLRVPLLFQRRGEQIYALAVAAMAFAASAGLVCG